MKKIFFSLIFIFIFQITSYANDKIYVYAASSLTNAINDVVSEYNKIYGRNVKGVYDGSGNLARQIKAGSPASIFISADKKWIDELQRLNLIEKDSYKNLLGNSLVVISNKNSKIDNIDLSNVDKFKNILGKNKFVIGNPDSVPNGTYAKEAFISLNLWDSLKDNLIFVQNVRVALSYVSMGEIMLGVVFSTDAKASNNVKVVANIPTNTHKEIIYPSVIIKNKKSKIVEDFYNFLQSDKAKKIYVKYGFLVE